MRGAQRFLVSLVRRAAGLADDTMDLRREIVAPADAGPRETLDTAEESGSHRLSRAAPARVDPAIPATPEPRVVEPVRGVERLSVPEPVPKASPPEPEPAATSSPGVAESPSLAPPAIDRELTVERTGPASFALPARVPASPSTPVRSAPAVREEPAPVLRARSSPPGREQRAAAVPTVARSPALDLESLRRFFTELGSGSVTTTRRGSNVEIHVDRVEVQRREPAPPPPFQLQPRASRALGFASLARARRHVDRGWT